MKQNLKKKIMELSKSFKEKSKETDKEKSNSELFKNINVENTPFNIVIDKEKNHCFGICGNFAVTEQRKLEDLSNLEEELKVPTWNKIMQILGILKKHDELINNKDNG